MLVRLIGVHKVKATLAGGRTAVYHYAWRGGPRIDAAPGTNAFAAEFHRLTRSRPVKGKDGTVAALILAYIAAPEFQKLKPATRKVHTWAIDRIEAEFCEFPLEAVGQKGARAEFIRWRDQFAETPRKADLLMAVLSRLFTFGLDREMLERNPLARIAKLADSTRRDIIWTDEQVAAFHAKAPARMVLALELARWTGQRQGDLLRLTWSAYDGRHIELTQSKTGRFVRVRVAEQLRDRLEIEKAARAKAVTILTNRSGLPFATGFGASWQKAMAAAGIEGVTFHDLRGTFVTLAYREGASIKEIAEVTGHSEKDAERIIRKHYLAADAAVIRLEERAKRADHVLQDGQNR